MPVLTAAIISADPELRRAIDESPAVTEALGIPVAAPEVGVQELEALEAARPELVVVDLGEDVELGLRLVQYLAESAPGRPVLVAGPAPSADLLLQTMRAGAAEYLETPVSAESFGAVVERLVRRRGQAPAGDVQRPGRVFAFVGVKGGMGTTMIASNVAVELRRRSGQEVLLADFHFGLGDAAVHLGLAPRFNVLDLVDNLHRMDPGLLASFVERDERGVQLLASPGEAERIDAVEPEQVRKVLRLLRKQYSYTVVDAPDPYSPHARAIFEEADRVFLVATPEVPALRNVERVMPLLRPAGDAADSEVSLVVNRHVASRSLPPEEIGRLVGFEVKHTIANDYEAVTTSINEGTPIAHSRTAVARDLARLATGLLASGEGAEASPAEGGIGILRSLTGWARSARRRDASPGTGEGHG